ncbi:hypothetical protein HBI56_023840 [Parastagonospora nodorum]|uniref:DUF7907 domain-containing protein n=2 Tax=Phaeosphaeria nodorum (strain SN15 / ATCC MYA-4574 / FGSC 10173) TaxID=321614 RepID=A0A7U2F4Y9_PHANO|nr:hypothetical protein SNOG_06180 [Parastagonospora nodorum SN15]KAH3918780.1 hypothetical protein HBH56_024660 [Parastagonospora nodorum]EAT86011.1 hypothetical protein SNOG_06180 [Parastagonospora nodorum SN15]KAH3934411.1 hypothetical protein HBH54_057340 [Parastagonospora nodorum]KAH3949979.1 hypothetical protein HBH53_085030 [Parastagonospora nodorum]KAH3975902.1 hypothetical protein HBH51_080320 [Parastagonospora nodorum]
MKTTFSVAALVAAASAQQYNITSKGFQLVLTSDDGAINSAVSACHTGAALESLCLSKTSDPSKPSPFDTFYFNTTSTSEPPVNHTELGAEGILTWFLPVNDYGNIPSSAYFYYDSSTDSATPILTTGTPVDVQRMSFTDKDELILQGYIDWTANPPKYAGPYGLNRWYACQTYYAGYQYTNLVWGLGAGKPENPTCLKVDVKRVFV